MSESRRRRIGYALTPEKSKKSIKISLLNFSKEQHIDLISIDPDISLTDQGHFDCILNNLFSYEWINNLNDYSIKNPNVLIIDPPDAVEPLRNRISMLQVVSNLNISQENETFGIPKQILISNTDDLLLEPSKVMNGLNFPVIAKPLVADGSSESHEMVIVFNLNGLIKLKPPIVLQEFVNHGGVIFKVYVAGNYVECVKRKSLPDISEEEKLGNSEGFLSLSRVSYLPTPKNTDDDDDNISEVEMLDPNFITDIARGLGKAMKLNLFNFDVIRDSRIGNHYLIIDINYFPGYEKLSKYETILTDFFCKVTENKVE